MVETCRYPPWRYQASTPSSSHQAPIPSTAASLARASSTAAAAPNRSRSESRLGHIEFAKPPLRPLGPVPHRSISSTTTRASGSSSERNHAVHIPVYPPPTTTTSASTSPASAGRGSGIPASSSHQPYGVCRSAIVGQCDAPRPPAPPLESGFRPSDLGLLHHLALHVVRLAVGVPAAPCAVLAESPRIGVVRQAALEDVQHLRANAGVLDRRHELHAVVEVARHEVGRPHEHALLFAGALEGVDARMLQEAPHHGDDLDVVRDARDARSQGADAADVELYVAPRLRGPVQRLDARR